jgi:hypothetical protein
MHAGATDQNFWGTLTSLGGYTEDNQFIPGFNQWIDYFKKIGETLAGCSEPSVEGQPCPSGCQRIFMGPSL